MRSALSFLLPFVFVLAAPLAPTAAEARCPKRDPGNLLREPKEAVHLLKDVYNQMARHEAGEVHETFSRMSRDPLSYFQGALVVFFHDLFDPARLCSHEPLGPTATLLGDAHIQNLGTIRDGRGTLTYDWIRFDHSTPGPVMVDLRRLLVSLVLLAEEISADVPDIEAILYDALHAYRDAVMRLAQTPGAKESVLSMETASPFVRRMLTEASHRLRTELLERWTVLTSQGRRFRTQGEFMPLAPEHRDAFDHALRHLTIAGRPPCFFVVKDATRRVWNGRGCRGHERIYLLVEGPTPDPDDDVILEAMMKPTPSLAHFCKDVGPVSPDQAARVIDVARRLSRSPDPFLARLTIGDDPYVLEEVQPWETRLSTDDVENPVDVRDLARASAYLLARAHALTADRPDKLQAFVYGWSRRSNAVEHMLVRFAQEYATQVRADHAVFKSHVDVKPLLVIPEVRGRRHRHHRRAGEPAGAGSPSPAAPASPEAKASPAGTASPAAKDSPAAR